MTTRKTRSSKKTAQTVAQNVANIANDHALVTVETVASAEETARDERAEFHAQLIDYRTKLATAFDARRDYERAKNASNVNIQKTLLDLYDDVKHEAIATVMLVANVDANFINRSERATARFNVYAAQKVTNIARTVAKVSSLNHYTLAILKTAIALSNAQSSMTHRDAQSACSLQVDTIAAKRAFIVRYAKQIDASTASTQSSSSLNALCAYDILREVRDASSETAYVVNFDSLVTQALIERIA